MSGLVDLDAVCLKEVFKCLTPLELCLMRQICTQFRDFVDDHFRSLYFAREQWLDLRRVNARNVNKILINFGRLVRRLKIEGKGETRVDLLLEVIATKCGVILKSLSLQYLRFYEFNMKKFAGIFDNLESLELIYCSEDDKYIEKFLLGHQYPNLTKLTIFSLAATRILKKFFSRKRNITSLNCGLISGDILPLIVQNSAEVESLVIHMNDYRYNYHHDRYKDYRYLMPLAQLRKLKRLEIYFGDCDGRAIIALIKDLAVNNNLEMLGIGDYLHDLTAEFCNALSNLTNLTKLAFQGRTVFEDLQYLEMLGTNLSKLESLMLINCPDFRLRKFLASARKSLKFRTIYIRVLLFSEIETLMAQMAKDFIHGSKHSCFVSGDPLYVYLHKDIFDRMKGFWTHDKLKSIEKYGNIKIRRANEDDFANWFSM